SPAPAPLGPVPAASPMKPSARPKSVARPIVPAAPRPAPAPAPRRPTARISTPARAPAAVRATPPPSPAPPAVVPGRHTGPGLLAINAIPWGHGEGGARKAVDGQTRAGTHLSRPDRTVPGPA